MAVFAGIDLSWTARHETGICILEGDHGGLRLAELEAEVLSPEEVAARLTRAGDTVVAAIDAPLVVTTERRAEAALARTFGRYGAYAYAARPEFLERVGGNAGSKLASFLGKADFEINPLALSREARGRFALEVYPHAQQVVLFGLRRILRYKRGRLADRREELDVYRCCLAQLADVLPFESTGAIEQLLWAPLDGMPGTALKRIEDQLDAFTCAISAFEAWTHGVATAEVFGDARNGYITVPGLARDERFR